MRSRGETAVITEEQGGMGRERDWDRVGGGSRTSPDPGEWLRAAPRDLAGAAVALRRCGVRVPRGLRGDVLEAQLGGRRSGLLWLPSPSVDQQGVAAFAGPGRSGLCWPGSRHHLGVLYGCQAGWSRRPPNAGSWRGSGAGRPRSGLEKRPQGPGFHAQGLLLVGTFLVSDRKDLPKCC